MGKAQNLQNVINESLSNQQNIEHVKLRLNEKSKNTTQTNGSITQINNSKKKKKKKKKKKTRSFVYEEKRLKKET